MVAADVAQARLADAGRERAFWTALLALGVTQGASYLFIRVAVQDLSPAPLMALRVLFAVPFLLAYVFAVGQASQLRGAWRQGFVVGIPGVAIPWLLIGWGASQVDAGVVAVANAAIPIFVAVLAIRLLPGERVTGTRLLGILIGLAGVAVLSGFRPEGGWWAVAGTLAVVAAAPLYALSFVLVQRGPEIGGVVLATTSIAAAGVVLLPVALLSLPAEVPSAETFGLVAALGFASTGFSTALFYWLVSGHGASRAAFLTYVTPAFTLLFAAFLLDEPLTVAKLAGLALIAAGVALGASAQRAPATP
jgi:drug/metabolite transporter (DMT)-like permease